MRSEELVQFPKNLKQNLNKTKATTHKKCCSFMNVPRKSQRIHRRTDDIRSPIL